MKFETENTDLIDTLSDDQEQPGHKRNNSQKLKDIFSKFGQDHITRLVLAAEKAERDSIERIKARQKPSYVYVKPENQILGRKPIHFILKMIQDVDDYERHRDVFKQALQDTLEAIKNRPAENERKLSQEREQAEAEAKILA